MKTAKNILIAALVIIALCWVMFFVGFSAGKESVFVQQPTTVKVYDTIVKTVNSEVVQGPVVMEPVSPPPIIDTLAILQDYFTRKKYEHNYRDNDLSISLKPVISHNQLDSLSFSYKILRPTAIQHFDLKPKNGLYLGGTVGTNVVAPALDFHLKDKWIIGAQYQLVNTTPGMEQAQWYERLQLKLTYKLISW